MVSLIAEDRGIDSGTLQEVQDRGVEAVVRKVHQDVPATDLIEDHGRVGAVEIPQPRMGHRLVWRVTQLGMSFDRESHQVAEAEQPGNRDHVVGAGVQLRRQPAPQLCGHVGADLHPDDTCVLSGGRAQP